MHRNLYTLLVGIDEYPNPSNCLEGCVNDVEAVTGYLNQRFLSDRVQLHIKTLLNKEATRENIIRGFREHLSQANKNDTVLFYYSGHGSQEENIPEAFWRFEPDRKNETLYCYDSGLPDHWHLADKELAKLIAEVAKTDPHICVILDCCHSGSGTKNINSGVVARQVPGDKRSRPLKSYIVSFEEVDDLLPASGSSFRFASQGAALAKHVLMAACEDRETAKEVEIDGKKYGIFSHSLLEVLERRGRLTYQELLQETKSIVFTSLARLSISQSPQLEVTPPENGNLLFLDGAIAEKAAYFTTRYDKTLGWVIDGGAIHNVQPPTEEEATLVALFEFNCNVKDLQNPDQSIGQAKVTNVRSQLSQLEITSGTGLSPEDLYKSVVINLPLPKHLVYIEGDAASSQRAEQAIQSATMGDRPSIYIRQTSDRDNAQLVLQCCDRQYQIRLKESDRALATLLQEFTAENAELAIKRLEHIARWFALRDLTSPPASRIQSDDVEMEILFEGETSPIADEKVCRSYLLRGNELQPPRCTIKLINKSQRTLYCTILALTKRFAVVAPFFSAGYVRLEPGQSAWAHDGDYIDWSVEPGLRKIGLTETDDILKLVISTAKFDAQLSTQGPLDAPRSLSRSVFEQTTLNRLMDRTQSRQPLYNKAEVYDDWYIKQIVFTTRLNQK